jgi:hypothetical protein
MKLKLTAIEMLNCYMRCMKKTPYQELMCLNGARGLQKEERMWKMINDLAVQ